VQADTPYKFHYKTRHALWLPVLPSGLPSFPFAQTFKLIEQCLVVATFLCLIAVPIILIGYEHWKERVR
jgi:hypothetical protein